MNLVSEARAATGLTQREFAAIIDVDPAQIGHWSSGKRRMSKSVVALMLVIEAAPQTAVSVLAKHYGVALKQPVSAAPTTVRSPSRRVVTLDSELPRVAAGLSPPAAESTPPAAGSEPADEDRGVRETIVLDSGYVALPDRGLLGEHYEDGDEKPAEPGPPAESDEDDAGFTGDGGPPPGRAPMETNKDDADPYGPNRQGDRGQRRAQDWEVPDFTPEFGYTGGQEPPGGGPE